MDDDADHDQGAPPEEQKSGAVSADRVTEDDTPVAGDPKPISPASTSGEGKMPSPENGPVDLTGLTNASAKNAGVSTITTATSDLANAQTPVSVQPYSMDATRRQIALILLSALLLVIAADMLFGVVIGFSCWTFGHCTQAQASMSAINATVQPIFTAMIGLVGSVVGFYFGSKNATS